jgi:hypothetical protein
MAMYFTSEADARKGEKKKIPAKLKAEMDEMNSLVIGETEFIDIHDPWLHSPHQ